MVHGPDPRAAGPGAEPHGHAHGEHGHGPEPHDPEDHDHHGFARVARAVAGEARRRRLRTGLLLALFTVAGTTLALELGLRLSDQRARALEHNVTTRNRRWLALSRGGVLRPLADPVRRYGLAPGADTTIDGWRFRVSAQETRGPDVPAPKPPGEKRLLVLGDSFPFGLWCDEEDTVAAQLARLASAAEAERGSGLVWRGLTLAVPGYHLGQTLRAFEQEGAALAPDLVVLYCNTNDIEQSGFYYDAELDVLRRDFLPLPVVLKETLWRWSHLYGWIATRHARAVEAGPAPWCEPRVPWAHVRADNQAYTRAALASLAERCRAAKLPLFVIHQPLMGFLGVTRADDWAVLPLERWFRATCDELGLPALHLLGWMRGYGDGVDRLAEGAPPDCLTDQYLADEEAQAVLAAARARVEARGEVWEALSFAEQVAAFEGLAFTMPAEPDFHLTGAGYRHIARLAHARLRTEGLLP
jgi:GDSL-like Lipase/Acylhydrolase family